MRNENLEELFSEFGPMVSHYTKNNERGFPRSYGTFIVMDHQTGRSRGFGFVEFDGDDAEENAAKAIEAMNGAEVMGRPLTVRYQEERPPVDRSQSRSYN